MDNLMLMSVSSMAALAILFASILAFADKKLKVKTDPRIEEIIGLLPGVNCGACGYLSCRAFGEGIVKKNEDPGKCRVIGEEAREELFKLLGKEESERYPRLPLVHCAAGTKDKKYTAEYNGVRTCSGADLVFGAGLRCEYGCMGFGDCVSVCAFGALSMEDGLPKADPEKCTGCGKCVPACPRGIISMQEKRFDGLFYVACSSLDGVLRVKEACGTGCIACGICEKLSPGGLFKVTENLSRPDYERQRNQEEAEKLRQKCPTKVIKRI